MKLHTADRVKSRIDLVDPQAYYLSHDVQKILWYAQSNQGKDFIQNYCTNVEYISGNKPMVLGSFLADAIRLKARLLNQGIKTYSKAKNLWLLFITNQINEWSYTWPINARESIVKWLNYQESNKTAEQSWEEKNSNGSEDAL